MPERIMMKNKIETFKNDRFGNVRIILMNEEPWFVGKDVAVILGYSNPQKAVRDHVDHEDRTVNESFTVNGTPVTLINESGLYSLIISSKLAENRTRVYNTKAYLMAALFNSVSTIEHHYTMQYNADADDCGSL